MLISAAPIVIPVTTANLPTEAIASEAIARPRIPQPTSPAENAANKNSTEFADQSKANTSNGLGADQQSAVNEKESRDDNQNAQNQNSNQDQFNQDLTTEQLAQVRQLRARDGEVRAHEQAHAAVGGSLAGAPNLSYTTGPDGKRYAISGEVSINTGIISGDPEATIRKLDQVRRAALAPANPSSQDRRVAASASASANQARSELNVEQLRENTEAAEIRKEKTQETQTESQTNTGQNTGVDKVEGRIRAENLAQRLLGSGAFELNEVGNNLSLTA